MGLKKLARDLFIGVAFYGFLSFCNWDLHPLDWNGFSRFVMACILLAIILNNIGNGKTN